mmetsp:Transcript_22813/g.58296  ORF Transcript_22813/g.58296 Transcript_22813/m.58296 type:complete len:305 (-) Transcript_22813:857-1771(-)
MSTSTLWMQICVVAVCNFLQCVHALSWSQPHDRISETVPVIRVDLEFEAAELLDGVQVQPPDSHHPRLGVHLDHIANRRIRQRRGRVGGHRGPHRCAPPPLGVRRARARRRPRGGILPDVPRRAHLILLVLVTHQLVRKERMRVGVAQHQIPRRNVFLQRPILPPHRNPCVHPHQLHEVADLRILHRVYGAIAQRPPGVAERGQQFQLRPVALCLWRRWLLVTATIDLRHPHDIGLANVHTVNDAFSERLTPTAADPLTVTKLGCVVNLDSHLREKITVHMPVCRKNGLGVGCPHPAGCRPLVK